MNLIVYLIAGAIVGYITSRIMRKNSRQGLLMDIVVGAIGALVAGYFISPLVGVGTINDAITIPTMLVTLGSAVALLLASGWSAADRYAAEKLLTNVSIPGENNSLVVDQDHT